MHQVKLKVGKLKSEDIYRDIARIPQIHRGGIKEGKMCLLKYGTKSVYVALRGLGEETQTVIKLDSKIRDDLGVAPGDEKDFELKEISFVRRYWALQYASDPFARTSYQMSLIAFVLGLISLVPMLVDLVRWVFVK